MNKNFLVLLAASALSLTACDSSDSIAGNGSGDRLPISLEDQPTNNVVVAVPEDEGNLVDRDSRGAADGTRDEGATPAAQ